MGVKILIFVICALVALIIAMVAGWLSRPQDKARIVLYASGVFGGTLTLFVFVLSSLGIF